MSPAAGETDGGLVLGIETATAYGSVALWADRGLEGELVLHNPRSHSERILPSVQLLLQQKGAVTGDLAAVAVSIGPGSFTGLRIGLAAAKGLAFSLGIPLYGVPTLEALAAGAAGPALLCPVLDARRGEVFAALFAWEGGELVRKASERVTTPQELVVGLPRGTVLVGEIPPSLRSLAKSRRGKALFCSPPGQCFPRASHVALRGASMRREGRPSEAETLLPLYLRPSDAESNSAGKKRKPN